MYNYWITSKVYFAFLYMHWKNPLHSVEKSLKLKFLDNQMLKQKNKRGYIIKFTKTKNVA